MYSFDIKKNHFLNHLNFSKLFCILQENFLYQWKRICPFYERGHEGKICISCSLQVDRVDRTSTVIAETFVDMEYQIYIFYNFFNCLVYVMLPVFIKREEGVHVNVC